MQKNQAYHESAILYNEKLAECAENLAQELEHEEVRKWCTSVGKQHRFHAKRHRSALNKLLLKQEAAPVEAIADGLDVPGEFTTGDETEAESTTESGNPPLTDGCSPFHNPSDPNCEFYPKETANG